MNYELLWAELRDDPFSIGYANMTDDEAAAALAATTQSAVQPISVLTTLRWAAQVGAIPKLRAAVSAGGAIGGIAEVVLALLNAQDTEIDLNDAEIALLFDVLAQARVFTAADKEALIQRATRLVSRADQLGLQDVSITAVHNARVWGPDL